MSSLGISNFLRLAMSALGAGQPGNRVDWSEWGYTRRSTAYRAHHQVMLHTSDALRTTVKPRTFWVRGVHKVAVGDTGSPPASMVAIIHIPQ